MNDIYSNSKLYFENEKVLYHFTSYEALISIISSKKFRLSNFSSINDALEKKYLDSFWTNKVFFISFTNEITKYFWNTYSRNSEEGVCISIENKNLIDLTCYDDKNIKFKTVEDIKNRTDNEYKSYCNNSDWVIYDISCLKVIYTDNPEDNRMFDYDLIDFYKECSNISQDEILKDFSSINGQGFIKENPWSKEKEYRIRITVRPIGREQYFEGVKKISPQPPFKYIFVDISNILNQIKIIVKDNFSKMDELIKLCENVNIPIVVLDN